MATIEGGMKCVKYMLFAFNLVFLVSFYQKRQMSARAGIRAQLGHFGCLRERSELQAWGDIFQADFNSHLNDLFQHCVVAPIKSV